MVDVPVIKAFSHEGRTLRVGDIVSVSPVVASVLRRRGLVSLTKGYKVAALQSDDPPEAPRRRRRYRRRDLTAEPA